MEDIPGSVPSGAFPNDNKIGTEKSSIEILSTDNLSGINSFVMRLSIYYFSYIENLDAESIDKEIERLKKDYEINKSQESFDSLQILHTKKFNLPSSKGFKPILDYIVSNSEETLQDIETVALSKNKNGYLTEEDYNKAKEIAVLILNSYIKQKLGDTDLTTDEQTFLQISILEEIENLRNEKEFDNTTVVNIPDKEKPEVKNPKNLKEIAKETASFYFNSMWI